MGSWPLQPLEACGGGGPLRIRLDELEPSLCLAQALPWLRVDAVEPPAAGAERLAVKDLECGEACGWRREEGRRGWTGVERGGRGVERGVWRGCVWRAVVRRRGAGGEGRRGKGACSKRVKKRSEQRPSSGLRKLE